jgi:hypothetical protein
MMMNRIEMMPSGAIIRPNSTTSQGMVRQPHRDPAMPVTISRR